MITKPYPVNIFVRNIRKGPRGSTGIALLQRLPSWACLGLGFIGGLVLVIITTARQKPQLVATLPGTGVREINEFEVFESTIRKKHNEKTRN